MITPGENWVIVDTVFSIGTAATGLGPTSLLYFPSASGEINSPFSGMRDCGLLFRNVLSRRDRGSAPHRTAADVHTAAASCRARHATHPARAHRGGGRRRSVADRRCVGDALRALSDVSGCGRLVRTWWRSTAAATVAACGRRRLR